MKVKDLIFISELDRHTIAYQLNISYKYLSEIRNRSINTLSRDLRLKIRLFILENNLKEIIEKFENLKKIEP